MSDVLTHDMVVNALRALGMNLVMDPDYVPDEPGSAPPAASLVGVLAAASDSAMRLHRPDPTIPLGETASPEKAERAVTLMVAGYVQGTTDMDLPNSVEHVINQLKIRAAHISNVLSSIGGTHLSHAQKHAAILLVRILILAGSAPDERLETLDDIDADLTALASFVAFARKSLKGEMITWDHSNSATESSPRKATSSPCRRSPRRPRRR